MLMGIWIVGSLPDEEKFYSNLSMKDITDADYKQSESKIENLIISKCIRKIW